MLTVDSLIEKLVKIKEEHGNIPIIIEEKGFGGRSFMLVNNINISDLHLGSEDDLEDDSCTLNDAEKEFLLSSDKDEGGYSKVIMVKIGGTIYST